MNYWPVSNSSIVVFNWRFCIIIRLLLVPHIHCCCWNRVWSMLINVCLPSQWIGENRSRSPPLRGRLTMTLHTEQVTKTSKTNVVDEWLTLMLRIREVPGSNLGPVAVYDDWGFRGFTQFIEATAGIIPQIRPRPLPTKSFPINHHSLITVSSTLYTLVTEKAS
jgi:hypothetical protein